MEDQQTRGTLDKNSRLSPSSSTVPPDTEDGETQPACEPASSQPAAEATNTEVNQPAVKTMSIEVNCSTAQTGSAPVTEAMPASTEVAQPVPPAAATTEVNCLSQPAQATPASTQVVQATQIPPEVIQPSNPTTTAAGMEAKENVAPMTTQSDIFGAPTQPDLQTSLVPLGISQNAPFNFQSSTGTMPNVGSFTSLLKGFNWDASTGYNGLGNGSWDETQALLISIS